MRTALDFFLLASAITLGSPMNAQTRQLEIQAGLGYARAFDGGGVSFAAALERPLSAQTSRIQHAVGGSLWYSEMSIGSSPNSSNERRMTGLGVRYEMELRAGRARPFLAVPVQVLRSNIPDRADLVGLRGGALSVRGVPDAAPAAPLEDRIGTEWGWGAGLEMGLRLGLSQHLSAQSSVQGLYHRIYESGTRNGAWTIHGGLTYHP
jgi:hypothetical protein